MRKPILTIFYQFNPWNSTIGGIQTLINIFIKYAPDEFKVRLVGTADNLVNQPLYKWQEAEFAGKEISFLPLVALQNDNVRHVIPTTLKYTAAMLGRCYASDFMHFYRLEPTIAALRWQGDKTLFIQNDVHQQMASTDDKNAILWRRFPQAYFALERLLVGQFTQILSCNTDSLELYQKRYPHIANRVAFLKNTFDEEIFYPLSTEERSRSRRNLAQKLGKNEETRFVLFAGRLHPQKDPLLLIRAISALDEPDIHLLIAGDGELAEQVRLEISQLGLSERVTMLGALKQTELADLHRICNALVLSSAFEGLPFVVLEALACGTPIVTTKAGETPKLLSRDSGFVCEERTPACIADALRKVVLHPENYSIVDCVRNAQPFAARTVVGEVYNQMWQRWEHRVSMAST
ncbi:glycosyltransferase [Iningainema tapete]|uniref:Glycosyltransferase n=1 Tax=Iningainema tapete BLCC-T55 TaxID=2748662 RepID=A0A8J7C0Q4_9CYAN|nr:glycosyltransferase [Iningainema tapete]MBD2778488.1 glycosyltransferase [Iningainema tapete BLCC-T55]